MVLVAGEEAEDSVLLQFLIDNKENNPQHAQHVSEDESEDEELKARVLQNVADRSQKARPTRNFNFMGVSPLSFCWYGIYFFFFA